MPVVMRACAVMCFVRLDTGKCRASPRHSPSPAVDRRSSRDRPSSDRGQQHTASPAKCPGSGKSSPASGKSSPVASPLIDCSRRRRSADYRNSPRHAASSAVCGPSSSVGGLGCEGGVRGQISANRHSVRRDGVQSASSPSGPMTDGRVKATTSKQHAGIHSAIHSATHAAVPAGGSEARLTRRVDMQSNVDDKNGNSQRLFTAHATAANTITTTAAAAAAAADDDDVDDGGKLRHECRTQQSLPSTDPNCASQVDCCVTLL